MLQAAIHSKAGRQWDSEDALTSLVIGVIALREHHDVLRRFLDDAAPPGKAGGPWLPPGTEVERVEFWPWLAKKRVEPDVRIDLRRPSGTVHTVFIEAKHHSGLSGEGNQLVREWEAIEAEGITDFSLIYLTGDYTCPKKDVSDALGRLGVRAGERLRWLSWRSLPRHLRNTDSELLRQLRQAMIRKDLGFFEGWPEVVALESTSWRFTVPEPCFTWSIEHLPRIQWGFSPINNIQPLGVRS